MPQIVYSVLGEKGDFTVLRHTFALMGTNLRGKEAIF